MRLDPILRSLGHGFLARTRISTYRKDNPLLEAMQRNVRWRMHRDWSRTRPKPCWPWVTIGTWVLRDFGAAKTALVA